MTETEKEQKEFHPQLTCWLQSFIEYSKSRDVQELNAYAVGKTLLAGALERRVWTVTKKGLMYLNQANILMAPPASGKSIAIKAARNVLTHVDGLVNTAPTSMTKASFVEYLASEECRVDPVRNFEPAKAPLNAKPYHACTILASELAGFIGHYDATFMTTLCEGLDAEPEINEHRTGLPKPRYVERPVVSIAGAIQPATFNELFPDAAWQQGLCTRMSYYYTTAQNEDYRSLFDIAPNSDSGDEMERQLARELEHKKFHWGRISFNEEAVDFMVNEWGRRIQPETQLTNVILGEYNARRTYKLIQDACLHAISKRKFCYEVSREDIEDALAWQLESEKSLTTMLEVSSVSGDSQILDQVYQFVLTRSSKTKSPVPHSVLLTYVGSKVKDIYKAENYINHLVNCNAIKKVTKKTTGTHTIEFSKPVYLPDPSYDGNLGIVKRGR